MVAKVYLSSLRFREQDNSAKGRKQATVEKIKILKPDHFTLDCD
jgi:hypothetical protein